MSQEANPITADSGRATAFVVYVLYLLSIPSFALFALAGVILAWVARERAIGLGRAHLENQIHIWWIAFLWGAGILVLTIVGWLLAAVLVGFPLIWLAWAVGFLVMLWFTVKSALGLIALLEGRQAAGWVL